jgi:hypothetical protein
LRAAVGASCLLTAPVKSRGHTLGVFFVDSPFEGKRVKDGQSFSDDDRRAFQRFVEDHVSPIFEQNHYIPRDHERRAREDQIENIRATSHSLLLSISSKVGRLRPDDLAPRDPRDRLTREVLDQVERLVTEARESFTNIYLNLRTMSSAASWAPPRD